MIEKSDCSLFGFGGREEYGDNEHVGHWIIHSTQVAHLHIANSVRCLLRWYYHTHIKLHDYFLNLRNNILTLQLQMGAYSGTQTSVPLSVPSITNFQKLQPSRNWLIRTTPFAFEPARYHQFLS